MLELFYDSKDAIPKGFESLYTEKDGKFVLTGVKGMKTQEDINRLTTSLEKERADHKEAKTKLKAFEGLDPEEVRTQLDRIPELEASAAEGNDKEKIDKLVEARVAQVKNPLERQITKLNEEKTVLATENNNLKSESRTRTINDGLRSVALASGMRPEAIDDFLDLSNSQFEIGDDGSTFTSAKSKFGAGLDPKAYVEKMQEARSYLWPNTEGTGALGSGGGAGPKNPWLKANWNLSEQGKIAQNDLAAAEKMAASAGVSVGATGPVK